MKSEPIDAEADISGGISTNGRSPKAAPDAPPIFNEQTHYVPVKTIITVSSDLSICITAH